MNILLIEDFPNENHFDYIKESFEGILFPNGTMTKLFIKADGKKGSITIDQIQQEINQSNANIPPYYQLNICTDYKDWEKKYETKIDEIFDLDLVIIDINLSTTKNTSFCPDDYKEMIDDFHKKAGIYIYSYLLKVGFSDDNITFFTANKNELDELKKSAVHLPKNHFEKGDGQKKEKFKEWLKERLNNDFLIFRRGVKEACKTLNDHISKIDENTPTPFLIYETLKDTEDKVYEADLDLNTKKDTAKHFLARINKLVNLNRLSFDSELFIYELSREWEKGLGYFGSKDRSKEITTMAADEKEFKSHLQWIMRITRNWIAHSIVESNNGFSFLTFVFLCSMRAYFNLKINKVLMYENILFCLVTIDNKKKDLLSFYENICKELLKNSNLKKVKEPFYINLSKELNELSNAKRDREGIKKIREYIRNNHINIIYSIILSPAFEVIINNENLLVKNLYLEKWLSEEDGFPSQLIERFFSIVKN